VAGEGLEADTVAPPCDYLYPPVCVHCSRALCRYLNLPRLICSTCGSVGPIIPQPKDYLGCAQCSFFTCAHCVDDLAAGRTLTLCEVGSDSGPAAAAAAGESLAVMEGGIAQSAEANGVAISEAPEGDYDAEASEGSGASAGSSSDSAADSDVAGLVQLTCTVPAQRGAGADAPAPSGSSARIKVVPQAANGAATWMALKQAAIDRSLALIGDPSCIDTGKRRKELIHAALCQAVARVGLPQGRCPADIAADGFKQGLFMQVLARWEEIKQGAAPMSSLRSTLDEVPTATTPECSAQVELGLRGVPDTSAPRAACTTCSCRSCGHVTCGTVTLTPAGCTPCLRGHVFPDEPPGGGQAPGSSFDGGVMVVDTPSPSPRRSAAPSSSSAGSEPVVVKCVTLSNMTLRQVHTSSSGEEEEEESPAPDH